MFVSMLFGHIVGDYFLQNKWMALNKNKHNGLGWLTCLVHCTLYTIAVCTFMWLWSPLWILLVFLSHFPIDKWSLAEKYLKLISGRSLGEFLTNPENRCYSPHIALRAGFNILIYTIVDNSAHLMILYYGYKLLFNT